MGRMARHPSDKLLSARALPFKNPERLREWPGYSDFSRELRLFTRLARPENIRRIVCGDVSCQECFALAFPQLTGCSERCDGWLSWELALPLTFVGDGRAEAMFRKGHRIRNGRAMGSKSNPRLSGYQVTPRHRWLEVGESVYFVCPNCGRRNELSRSRLGVPPTHYAKQTTREVDPCKIR
jgi:hypothetical protein